MGPAPGDVAGRGGPCTRDEGLRSDLGENLLLAIDKAGDGDAVYVIPLPEGIVVEMFKATLCYLRGKP